MRKINTDSWLENDKFKQWQIRAKNARQKIIITGKPKKFKQKIYKDLKHLIINEFAQKKCMYCEGNYLAGAHDDAEHFRPKGEVTEWNELTEKRDKVDGHDGYYWLAYEWQNILLACTKCNSPHPDGEGNKTHQGKLNEFPISSNGRIMKPSSNPDEWWIELKTEEPLLLHPYFDQPKTHFEAKMCGAIWGKTKEGEATIRTCDLNRPALCSARFRAERDIRTRAVNICNHYIDEKNYDSEWVTDAEEFSFYLNERLASYSETLINEATGESVVLT